MKRKAKEDVKRDGTSNSSHKPDGKEEKEPAEKKRRKSDDVADKKVSTCKKGMVGL